MPRVDGEFIPLYPPVEEDTTIESAVHNGIVADFIFDANDARPITAGGTGGVSATEARANLSVEVRGVAVTNYDSHTFEVGSFFSLAGATGAPTPGDAYVGSCLSHSVSGDLFLSAVNQTTGTIYTRRRTSGTWSLWTATTDGLATIDYVNSVVSNDSLQGLAYNGMQINGDMKVAQEKPSGTGTNIGDASQYICDGWKSQNSGAVDVTWHHGLNLTYFPGVLSNISSILNTAKLTLAAGDIVGIYQNIEGYRIAKLMWGTAAALPITIGFWVLHTRAGTYTGTVSGAGTNPSAKSYAFSYTQNVGSALEYKTVVIPGCPDGGTASWFTDNRVGMKISFVQACGASGIAPSLNTWVAGSYSAGPGQINAIASDASAFRITGVVVLPGTQALTAAQSPLIMRPYDQELVTCQRYWQLIRPDARFDATAATRVLSYAYYTGIEMRASPTITQVAVGSSLNATVHTVQQFGSKNGEVRVSLEAIAAGNCYSVDRTFSLDARL